MLDGLKVRPVSIAITDLDQRYMEAMPAARRVGLMRRIMCGAPTEERQLSGNASFVKAILRLRANGLRLIDLQRQERAFSAVWYRRNTSMLGLPISEAMAVVVWELSEYDEELTTLKIWRI